MSENIENKNETLSAESSAGTENTDKQQPAQQNNEIMIPKSRFDEINGKYKETAAQLAELHKQHEGLSGEFENAKKTIEKYESRTQELEGYIAKMLEMKIEKVPEDKRDLIPEGLTPEQKLAWLEKAEAKGLFSYQAEKQIGTGTNPQQKQSVDLSKLNPFQLLQMGYKK